MFGGALIDAHHHLWDLSVRDQPWIAGLAALRRTFTAARTRGGRAAAAGVEATVLVQTVTVAEETPELLALAADDPLIAGVVGWIDLTAADVADALAALRGGRSRRHPPSGPGRARPGWLCRPTCAPGCRPSRARASSTTC